MKKIRIICTLFIVTILLNCTTIVKGTSDAHPDFKIGKKGFENSLKKQIDFNSLGIGTYISNKNGISKEKGLNLTFLKNNITAISDSLFYHYSEEIKLQTIQYLLNLDTYDYINITFKSEEVQKDLTKSTSIKIKKALK
jgi:hypothetical protein